MEVAIVSFLVLVTAGIGLYRWGRRPSSEARQAPPARDFQGLFPPSSQDSGQVPEADEIAARNAAELREGLLARAAQGDLSCLSDAQAFDSDLYNQVLGTLAEWSLNCQEKLQGIVSYIVQHPELRANRRIADGLVKGWVSDPRSYSAPEVIHIAALADDPEVYLEVVEAALKLWREGKLAWLSGTQLYKLLESQYWMMSADARHSGAAFPVKRELARIREELAVASPDSPQ